MAQCTRSVQARNGRRASATFTNLSSWRIGCDLGQERVQCAAIVESTVAHHANDLLRVRDVHQRIGVEEHEVSRLSHFDGARAIQGP